jgi:hypothetical protein
MDSLPDRELVAAPGAVRVASRNTLLVAVPAPEAAPRPARRPRKPRRPRRTAVESDALKTHIEGHVRDAYARGVRPPSYRWIAARVGCSKSHVGEVLKAAGLTPGQAKEVRRQAREADRARDAAESGG